MDRTLFLQATAWMARPDLGAMAQVWLDPECRLEGGPRDWGKLEEEVQKRTVRGWDRPDACGAAVGHFNYDGSFAFAFYPPESGRLLPIEELAGEGEAFSNANADPPPVAWREFPDQNGYAGQVRAAQEEIAAGNIYQVNLARRFEADVPATFDPADFARVLWECSEAPQSAYFRHPDYALASASPELFLSISGKKIVTRPVKGTRPRDRDPEKDEQQAFELSTNPKEIAELVMITDLERNDLGQICEYGSVRVVDLAKRERHSHVFHLVSTVQGELRAEWTPVRAVRACFPGGSITGAPKRTAMEIIRRLEPFDRGFFTGAIGCFGYDGSVYFNIAIRTARWRPGKLEFFTGSGITALSDPGQEFRETGHKALVLREAVARYCAQLSRTQETRA
jgi:anthranilate/para-aminobenzoate synthase component I